VCTLHSRITELCKERGISGSRMCLDLGMSKSTLSDLKSGRKKSFTAETAHKIASYLNVSVAYLLGEEKAEEDKKEQPIEFDGLSEKKKVFINKVMQMSEAELDKLNKILSIVENTK
jgi:transcriptional regulator with XRE-family HTH domain